jgi:hypothetical protein
MGMEAVPPLFSFLFSLFSFLFSLFSFLFSLFSFLFFQCRWAGAFTVGSPNKHGSELENCSRQDGQPKAFPITVKRRVLVWRGIHDRIENLAGHRSFPISLPTVILGLAVQSRFLLTTVPFIVPSALPYPTIWHLQNIHVVASAIAEDCFQPITPQGSSTSIWAFFFLPPARLPFPYLITLLYYFAYQASSFGSISLNSRRQHATTVFKSADLLVENCHRPFSRSTLSVKDSHDFIVHSTVVR